VALQSYECLFIFDSNKYSRDPNGVAASVSSIIEKCGGQVLASRLWAEQKLAYPIDGHQKGTYWLTFFKMESTAQPDFNRQCQLNESVVRYMVTKVDARLIDTLVAHALGKTLPNELPLPSSATVAVASVDRDEEGVEGEE
jgi:small subunit ribosomal protein S6